MEKWAKMAQGAWQVPETIRWCAMGTRTNSVRGNARAVSTQAASKNETREASAGRGRLSLSSLRLVGLGFWQAWWMLSLCTSVVLPFGYSSAFPFDPTLMVLLVTALGYLAAVALSRRSSPFLKKPLFLWLAVGCSFVGTLAMALLAHGALGDALAIPYTAATVVFSLGNALLLIMWGELWSTLATGRVGRFLYVSYAFAFMLFFFIDALPFELAFVLTALLPVASILVLKNAQSEPRREPASVGFDMEPISRLKVFASLVLLSVAFGVSQSVVVMSGQGPAIVSQAFFFAGAGIVALALNIFIVQPPVESFSLLRPVVPALACGLILITLLPPEFLFVGSGLTIIAIYSMDMLIMLVSTDVAFRARIPVALIFGLAIFASRIGTFIGTIAFRWAAVSPFWSEDIPDEMLLACVAVVILVGSLLFSQSDLQKLYRLRVSAPVSSEPVRDKCLTVGSLCGLTAREQEVLCLLASGRTVPYICEELCIARGTAKHHVSNIYRKLGVYDRQGLHDVIDQGSVGRGAL
jgi:DNA-binding CsgD family transcriptional regulator